MKSKGSLKSLYCRTVCGVGIVGLQNIYPNLDLEYKKSYDRWRSMLTRCYNENLREKAPTYKDVFVSKEWLYYPNFKIWFDENYYTVDNELMCLDKDILIKGNKLYSPNTCIFVPARINELFTKSNNKRGKYPIGVNYRKKTKKFVAQCSDIHGVTTLGSFNTPEEAFYKYKSFKERSIKIIANEYKDKIPKQLYDAMYNYKVEITD
jgi:hypothetical protein